MAKYIVKDYECCPFWWADGDQCSLPGNETIVCPKVMGDMLGFVTKWWLPDECPLKAGPVIVRLKEWNGEEDEDKKENTQKDCAG